MEFSRCALLIAEVTLIKFSFRRFKVARLRVLLQLGVGMSVFESLRCHLYTVIPAICLHLIHFAL